MINHAQALVLLPRNLFLGYYVPYRHTIPLWEMETDYYLHNFHVRNGRGTCQSMKEFQMDFGVLDWNDDEQKSEGDIEKDSTISSHSLRLSHHRAHSRNTTLGSIDVAGLRHEEQVRRVQKVRERCTSQNKALSVWWKIALQSNVQQRMWMKIGNNPLESTIPPRFDRLYQPEKLAQFDRFFARPWATPVRRSHSAQHNPDADDDAEIAVFRRIISGSRHVDLNSTTAQSDDALGGVSGTTLEAFIHNYGFGSKKQAMASSGTHEESPNKTDDFHIYIGDMNSRSARAQKEYEEYVQPQDKNSSPFRRLAFEEFKQALQPLSLGADDVGGIRKVREIFSALISPPS